MPNCQPTAKLGLALAAALFAASFALACAQSPGPDIQATVDAAVDAAIADREAEQARIAAAVAATATAAAPPPPPSPSFPAGATLIAGAPVPTVDPQGSLVELVMRTRPSVVKVTTPSASGSGVIAQASGDRRAVVVTNYHVIEGARGNIRVRTADGATYDAVLRGYDKSQDIAALAVCCSSDFQAAEFRTEHPDQGADVFTMGYPPNGDEPVVTRGVVSGKQNDEPNRRWILRTDAPMNRGNSGGPLVDLEGKVVGVNSFVAREDESGERIEGAGFAVCSLTVINALPTLLSGAAPPPPRPSPTAPGDIEGFVGTFSADVDLADFSAEVAIENPFRSSQGTWNHGFLIRSAGLDALQGILVTSDGQWSHIQSDGIGARTLDSGPADALRTGASEENQLRVVALGDRGWLFVNGELTASVDLSGGAARGNVAVVARYFPTDPALAGREPEYDGFEVREIRRVAGVESSGEIAHTNTDFTALRRTGVSGRDFVAEATFLNPYEPGDAGGWDYEIGFRSAPDRSDVFHSVVLSDMGMWEHVRRDGSGRPDERREGKTTLNAGAGERNTLLILAVGGAGALYVNGAFIAELDLSEGPASGEIWLGTGAYTGNQRAGAGTAFEGLRVWSLD